MAYVVYTRFETSATVLLRKKLAYYARSHARPFTRSTPVRFTPNARARMRTFSLVRHSTGTP